MGDLSRRKIEPDQAIACEFRHDGDGQQGRKRRLKKLLENLYS